MALKYFGDKDKLINFFKSEGWKIKETGGIIGVKAITHQGLIINWYNQKGTIQFQGNRNKEIESKIIDFINRIGITNTLTTETENIYIIHGHDQNAKYEIENILMKWKLNPKATVDEASSGKTIIEAVLRDLDSCKFAIVLLTPDDLGHSNQDDPKKAQFRARQNVIFELGMAIGKLGRERVLVLKKPDVEIPSDFNGVVYKEYKNSIREVKSDIKKELKALDIKIND